MRKMHSKNHCNSLNFVSGHNKFFFNSKNVYTYHGELFKSFALAFQEKKFLPLVESMLPNDLAICACIFCAVRFSFLLKKNSFFWFTLISSTFSALLFINFFWMIIKLYNFDERKKLKMQINGTHWFSDRTN